MKKKCGNPLKNWTNIGFLEALNQVLQSMNCIVQLLSFGFSIIPTPTEPQPHLLLAPNNPSQKFLQVSGNFKVLENISKSLEVP